MTDDHLSGDGLQRYLRSWNPRLLTAAEEIELARRRDAGDRSAVDELVVHNLRLVYSIARRYMLAANNQGTAMDDLLQVGALGLIRAAEKFNGAKGFKFSTYATWWIRQAIQRVFANDRTVRIPTNAWNDVLVARRAEAAAERKAGREPTLEEIALEAKMPAAKVEWLLGLFATPLSLDYEQPEVDEAVPLLSLLVDDRLPEDDVGERELKQHVRELLATLGPRERFVLERRFGFDERPEMTLEEIAGELGVTRERVRQIQMRALEALRLRAQRAA